MNRLLSRRNFLQGASVLTLSFLSLRLAEAQARPGPWRLPVNSYGDWRDIYREHWRWDRVVKGAHHVINCASACPFNLYVKDGIVLREEQNTVMDAVNPSLPDFNPRGCQKGVCFSQLMYDPARLRHPLKRVGARGSGRWKRITWDQALDEIADKIIEVAVEDGPECVVYDNGTANAGYGSESAEIKLFDVLRSTQLDGWAAVGDMPLGVILTMGLFNVDSSADDYFNSDLIFLWLGNPSYTRIPDAHFIWEARYNGSKVVSIAPDYNASTMHCDKWLNLRVGSDAALALGMAKVIIDEGLYDEGFVKEQTDLSFLVRDDNGRFLRQSDLESGGKDDVFYLWNSATGAVAQAPSSEGLGRRATLKLKSLQPALEGRFQVELADGSKLWVRPVLELLKERLEDYTAERAAEITGLSPEAVIAMARETAAARAVSVFGSWGMMKHHHSDLFQRGICLLLALTGNTGRRGTGLRIGAWYMMSGIEDVLGEVTPTWWQKLLLKVYQPPVRDMIGYFRDYESEHMYMNVPALMFLYQHGGLNTVVDEPSYHDANPGIPLKEAMKQCVANRWVPSYPRDGKQPRMYIHTRVNPLRRWPAPQLAKRHLWPKLDLIVGLNIKMSATCLMSDIVLPGAGYYERRGIKYAQSYVPYYIVGDQAVAPVAEARNDWEIAGLLAKRIQEKARAGGVAPVKDVKGKEVDLADTYRRWSKDGRFHEADDLPYYEAVTSNSPEMGNIGWEEAASRGAIRIKDIGPFRTHTNICSDYDPNETVYSSQWFYEKRMPWPTLTGRMQFYLDHDWYLRAGEHLPIHKDPPKAGGDYPLKLTGGHTRWSIHSTFADQPQMLQLQRGEPIVFVGEDDAAERDLKDGDRVRVFNDVGSCQLIAKTTPSLQPGQVVIYHAWEPHCFEDWQSNQEPVPSPWKSLHMTEYGQLHYRFLFAGPHHTPRATAVEVEKA